MVKVDLFEGRLRIDNPEEDESELSYYRDAEQLLLGINQNILKKILPFLKKIEVLE